jgi:uncharacterized membrane protein YhaH (DUF805 family)
MKKLLTTKGRLPRSAFWAVGFFFIITLAIVVVPFDQLVPQEQKNRYDWIPGLVLIPIVAGFLIVAIIVQIRRWHDLNQSGWWVLINLIPYLGALVTLIACGFVKGTKGDNRFGPDPFAPPHPSPSTTMIEKKDAPPPLPATNTALECAPLLKEIVDHSNVVLGDRSQDERIAKLLKGGPGAVPAIRDAVNGVVISGQSTDAFENAGLLCETLGKIGGAEALPTLINFATLESRVAEYRFIRNGAIRGLAILGDARALDSLLQVKQRAPFRVDVPALDAAIKQLEEKKTNAATPVQKTDTATPVLLFDRKFDDWNYNTATELERLTQELPVIGEQAAKKFFAEVDKVSGSSHQPVARASGTVFATLKGFISACDRHDVKVECLLDQGHIAHGIMRVESFDRVMGALFCAARVSDAGFLTLGVIGDKEKDNLRKLFETT